MHDFIRILFLILALTTYNISLSYIYMYIYKKVPISLKDKTAKFIFSKDSRSIEIEEER